MILKLVFRELVRDPFFILFILACCTVRNSNLNTGRDGYRICFFVCISIEDDLTAFPFDPKSQAIAAGAKKLATAGQKLRWCPGIGAGTEK
ncbi:MAG: hypothetical protein QM270_04385 [Bacillota bacterium]|nr:hypothetical protein [Bacillota bacterium]